MTTLITAMTNEIAIDKYRLTASLGSPFFVKSFCLCDSPYTIPKLQPSNPAVIVYVTSFLRYIEQSSTPTLVQIMSYGSGALAIFKENDLSPLLNSNLFLSPNIPFNLE